MEYILRESSTASAESRVGGTVDCQACTCFDLAISQEFGYSVSSCDLADLDEVLGSPTGQLAGVLACLVALPGLTGVPVGSLTDLFAISRRLGGRGRCCRRSLQRRIPSWTSERSKRRDCDVICCNVPSPDPALVGVDDDATWNDDSKDV